MALFASCTYSEPAAYQARQSHCGDLPGRFNKTSDAKVMENSTRPHSGKEFIMRQGHALMTFQTLEGKATKHQARQDDLLTRAVWRVWKARSRAPLLERVRAARLLEEAMAVWKSRLRNMREREGRSILMPHHAMI